MYSTATHLTTTLLSLSPSTPRIKRSLNPSSLNTLLNTRRPQSSLYSK